jgi:flavin reductase (DIM6/NTAB) family NADH-FMN oxidoreductase RutF
VSVTSNIDPSVFRAVLGHAPTSVVVVTGCNAEGKPFGITIGSFVSVSLDPPLVGFLPGTSSGSWKAISESRKFCVNILGANQDELCWRFAKEGDDKFSGINWSLSAAGNPVLDDVIGVIDCTVESETVVGDHYFVVGRVSEMSHATDVQQAMVFFRGKVVSATYPSAS